MENLHHMRCRPEGIASPVTAETGWPENKMYKALNNIIYHFSIEAELNAGLVRQMALIALRGIAPNQVIARSEVEVHREIYTE